MISIIQSLVGLNHKLFPVFERYVPNNINHSSWTNWKVAFERLKLADIVMLEEQVDRLLNPETIARGKTNLAIFDHLQHLNSSIPPLSLNSVETEQVDRANQQNSSRFFDEKSFLGS